MLNNLHQEHLIRVMTKMTISGGDLRKIEENVSTLQRDMAQVGTLVDRLDITIEKLTEVSTTVSRLLAVQANRLEVQEKTADKIQELIEQRRVETDKTFKDIYDRIDSVELDLEKELKDQHNVILKKIEELRTDGSTQHKQLNDRMSKLEKWMWIVVGAGAVLGFLSDKINYTSIFHN